MASMKPSETQGCVSGGRTRWGVRSLRACVKCSQCRLAVNYNNKAASRTCAHGRTRGPHAAPGVLTKNAAQHLHVAALSVN